MTTHAYAFREEAEAALLKALHLEGRRVDRIELIFEVGQPARMIVHEYAAYEQLPELVLMLEGIDWKPVEFP